MDGDEVGGLIVKCPESIEELDEMARNLPLCKVTLYEQAKARIKSGAAKSVTQATEQIGEETGKNPESIRKSIQREEKSRTGTLSQLSGTDKHRPKLDLSDSDKKAIVKATRNIKKERREIRQEEREKQRQETLLKNPPLENENKYKLIHGDFRKSKIEEKSIDAIITDPPYGIDYLPLYKDLSLYASRVLKPDAPCIVMIGQSWLEKALNYLSSNLTYVWTFCYFSPGKSTQVFARKIKSNWKPVIFLVNGKNECEHIGDWINSGKYDKRFHDWGQTEEGMQQLIERFTVKGDIVLDPFCGAGTTGVAAIDSERFFIGIDQDEYAIKQTGQRLLNMVG